MGGAQLAEMAFGLCKLRIIFGHWDFRGLCQLAFVGCLLSLVNLNLRWCQRWGGNKEQVVVAVNPSKELYCIVNVKQQTQSAFVRAKGRASQSYSWT